MSKSMCFGESSPPRDSCFSCPPTRSKAGAVQVGRTHMKGPRDAWRYSLRVPQKIDPTRAPRCASANRRDTCFYLAGLARLQSQRSRDFLHRSDAEGYMVFQFYP
jgi:hypothetical protein